MEKKSSALEGLVMLPAPFGGLYQSRRVFLTGHTGFKGSWLASWLARLGAHVTGYALESDVDPCHFALLAPPVRSIIGDIRDRNALAWAIRDARPEIVFHLAAQPLVRRSYREPVDTFATNVMGTINLLEACRSVESVQAIVNITSDKCYENNEWIWGYRESDSMGGHDPYSASKGCAELVTASWRNSFYHPDEYGRSHQILLASARAGNVIGGGDWSEDRLIPDIMRAISSSTKVVIRNPRAIRPWQHVLDPLNGYLLLGQMLLEGKKEFAQGWNFGPTEDDNISVKVLVQRIRHCWDEFDFVIQTSEKQPHEASLLKLDCTKARVLMGWRPIWDCETAITKTVEWYKNFYCNNNLYTCQQIDDYMNLMFVKSSCKE